MWLNREVPFQVTPDEGTHCIYEDGWKVQAYPMLPWFHAVDTVMSQGSRQMDWSGVDFVASRNTLRKLLRWTKESKPDDFRIDTQLAGERTVVFGQWVERMWMNADKRYPGYGRSFEHESTCAAPGLEHLNTTGHTRIIKYTFGGLTMVVGFEVDAYIASGNPSGPLTVEEATFSPNNLRTDVPHKPYVDVIHAGSQVPQENLVEIKTGKKIRWKETYPQLFLSQTPHLFAASHEQGQFHQIRRLTTNDPEMRELAAGFQGDFSRLRNALVLSRDALRRHKQSARLSLNLC
ncbi:uncharacterized protein C8Q71DRAFT_782416 [Rhodofomes roseus]|uniref:Uncharacterized protein n=1 Tax=Rhodofomes roseus TaxID=34475 RepID=A0ABQ8K3L7_9APHY|nr:uncharacterized protein C8Q71DRAFT_782416 [Rhodofomes roseus]KAH9831407.1 hypothetical protein C8Q71DRAFT_782416 [Rhodofomes roseus]